MKVYKAYKTELKLNNKQRTLCLKSAGAARFAYNWGLRRKIDTYEAAGKSPTAIDLHKELVAAKKAEFPWMYEVSKCAPQEALRNLDGAFNNFFRRCKAGGKPGFPKFKSRHKGIGSFSLTGCVHARAARIKLPRIGWVRLKESGYLPVGTKPLRTTVSEKAGHWFVSVQVEEEVEQPSSTGKSVGVDVGVSSLASLSNGVKFDNPKPLKCAQKKLRRLNQSVSRKQKGSNNRKKAVRLLQRQQYRVSCIRKDATHKATTAIIKSFSLIGIESLNVAGMLKNHNLAASIADAAMSEFLSQLKYKAGWYGCTIVEAPRFYPSSKTCSKCGNVKSDLKLSDRTYRCDVCGLSIDRDLNAAINLKNLAVSSTAIACGDTTSGDSSESKRVSTKQESNSKAA